MSHQLPCDTGMPLCTQITAEGQEGGTQRESFGNNFSYGK